MSKFEGFILLLVCIMISIGLLAASKHGAADRSFDVKDDVTGNVHSVTERSIEVCKTLPHYVTVVLDGVERRCVKNVKIGATNSPKEK